MAHKARAQKGRPPIDPDTVVKIVEGWLNLETDKEIASELGISEHTVFNKLKLEREKRPTLELLRAYNNELKKGKVFVLDSMRAARVLAELEKNGFDVKTKGLVGAETIVKQYGSDVTKAIQAGERIMALEREEETDFTVLMAEAERLQIQIDEGIRTFVEQCSVAQPYLIIKRS